MATNERLRDTTYRDNCQHGQGSPSELGEYGVLIDGEWLKTSNALEVCNPVYVRLVPVGHRAGPREIESAIATDERAFGIIQALDCKDSI